MINIQRIIVDSIATLHDDVSIIVERNIVPMAGNIEHVPVGPTVVQVHPIRFDSNKKVIIKFSMTKHPKSHWVSNLESMVMEKVGGENPVGIDHGRLNTINDPMYVVYEFSADLFNGKLYEDIVVTILETLGKLNKSYKNYTITVDDTLVPSEGSFEDVEYNNYIIQLHQVQPTDKIQESDIRIRFSISANPYTADELSTVDNMVSEVLDSQPSREVLRINHDPEEEVGLEDAGALCVVYEMKLNIS